MDTRPRRAAAPGRLTATLPPWPENVCSSTDIHTRNAAIRMTVQTKILLNLLGKNFPSPGIYGKMTSFHGNLIEMQEVDQLEKIPQKM